MPFQKGRKKTGGRKPFTSNKITRDVTALLDKLNCNPIEGMALIAADMENPVPIRARMYAELSQYVSPKLQSVQHKVTGSGPNGELEISNVSGLELLRARIARVAERSGIKQST